MALTEQEFIAEGKRQGVPVEELERRYEELKAQGAFDNPGDVQKRTRDQMVGTDSAEEEFDRYRPRLVDDYVGEDWSRSFDAGVMGMGEQIRSFQRGIENLNPWQSDEEEAENIRLAQGAEQLAERSYGESNPAATMAGEVLTTAPTWFLPGGLLAQMGYGAVEAGLDHSSNSNAGLNALVGGVTTGIFGKAFDMVGRMFGNGAGVAADAVTGRPPRVPGQTADETRRLLKLAKDEGVNLTPPSVHVSAVWPRTRPVWPLSRLARRFTTSGRRQKRQINQMVADRFGIENGGQLTSDVMNEIDRAVSKAYKEAEEGLTRTVGDDEFVENATKITTMRGLKRSQHKYLDEVAKEIKYGMDGPDLIRTRKELQRAKSNAQVTNGDYADALHLMVEQIDDLIERTAPTGVGARFADARDMARVQKAIEKTSGVVGTDGNINGRSFNTALGNIYKREYKRGYGFGVDKETGELLNPATERVFDAQAVQLPERWYTQLRDRHTRVQVL